MVSVLAEEYRLAQLRWQCARSRYHDTHLIDCPDGTWLCPRCGRVWS